MDRPMGAGEEGPIGRPWERRPDESAKAFAAFVIYRDLGTARSLERTREEIDRKPGYVRVLAEWSSRFDWVKRAEAFDADMDAKRRESMGMEAIEAAKKHVEIAATVLEHALKRLESLDPDEIHARDLPNWVGTAVKLHRQALGMDTIEAKGNVENLHKITFVEVNSIEKERAEWEEIRTMIIKVLDRYPEAKDEILHGLEAMQK